jgi:serine/threonine protein kinase
MLPAMAANDTLAGRYRLEAPLGAGGMATVHKAQDVLLGRKVAVKILAANVAASPAHLERFGREARAMASIAHPNLVAIYDVGWADEQTGHTPFLVMELVSGGTLAQRLAAEGPLDPPAVAALVDGLASALEALHRAGIVHRDVKPQNVLLAESGPKLADLGIIRVDDPSDPEAAALTASGATPGTLRFLAPEVIFGQSAGPKADAYALAMVAYEAITGRSPRPAVTLGDLVDAAWRPVTPVSEARPALGTAFDVPFAAALSMDPNERLAPLAFASALRDVASSWAEAEPTVAGIADSPVTEVAALSGVARLNPTASRPEDATTAVGGPEVTSDGTWDVTATDPVSRVLAPLGILALVLGIIVVALLLGRGGSVPSAFESAPASIAEPTPSPTPTATDDAVALAQRALEDVRAAIEQAQGGRDGLSGGDANELDALADDVGRALDAGDFAEARTAADQLGKRADKLSKELDEVRRDALENAIDALVEAIPST